MASVLIGQNVVEKLIKKLGRASLIVFVLALTIFVSAILLGSVGISNMAKTQQNDFSLLQHKGFRRAVLANRKTIQKEVMWTGKFEDICVKLGYFDNIILSYIFSFMLGMWMEWRLILTMSNKYKPLPHMS